MDVLQAAFSMGVSMGLAGVASSTGTTAVAATAVAAPGLLAGISVTTVAVGALVVVAIVAGGKAISDAGYAIKLDGHGPPPKVWKPMESEGGDKKKRPRETDGMDEVNDQLDGIMDAHDRARQDSKTFDDGTRVPRSRDNQINGTGRSTGNWDKAAGKVRTLADVDDVDDDVGTTDHDASGDPPIDQNAD